MIFGFNIIVLQRSEKLRYKIFTLNESETKGVSMFLLLHKIRLLARHGG